MRVVETKLPGVLIIEPDFYEDKRGFFLETYNANRYRKTGIEIPFVQDNLSRSKRGVLRGLHYQLKYPQGKLVSVVNGEVFDVAVDIRLGSPAFGQWFGMVLNETTHRQMYIPPGFAHGFCALSDSVDFMYKCSEYYHPKDEYGLLWNDANIGIKWPVQNPIISDKDLSNLHLSDIPSELLPIYPSNK